MHPSASEFFHFNSRPHGGRQNRYSGIFCMHHFNSRPHGGRLAFSLILSPIAIFQLTPSRRATKSHEWRTVLRDISTHALTEGDIGGQGIAGILSNFNSRPHGGRPVGAEVLVLHLSFQLTPSRRATCPSDPRRDSRRISTHALTEGDIGGQGIAGILSNFNSRPHGGRPVGAEVLVLHLSFQLTPSRRATCPSDPRRDSRRISTHALTEGDRRFHFRPSNAFISTHALTEGDHSSMIGTT